MTAQPTEIDDEQRTALIKELDRFIENTHRNAKKNYYAAYILAIVLVCATISTTVLAVIDISKLATAIAAALPTALLIVNNTFRFQAKSRWFWKKNRILQTYRRALKYRGVSVEEISQRLDELDEILDREYVTFGGVFERNQHEDPTRREGNQGSTP